MAVRVAEQVGLYRDPALERYVAAVGQRLVDSLGETPYSFRFSIVDQYQPNAFATPGGFIYVSRGLLTLINDEAELAGVLAHEISHVTRRHHARQAGRSFGADLFTLPGRAVGVLSEDLGNMINAPVAAAGQVYLSSFSRSQESEADRDGMRLAAAAGYEPRALATALENLEHSLDYLTGQQHEASFFDSHPTTPARVADIHRHAASLTVSPGPPLAGRNRLLGYLDGLWAGPQNPQQGIFVGQVYLNAELQARLQFPPRWKTINTPLYVAASAPDRGAFLALGSAGAALPVDQLARRAAAQMRQETGLEPSVQRSLMLGSWPAELIRYDEGSGEDEVSLYYLFVAAPRDTFTLMAMGRVGHRDALRATALSLGPLSAAERDRITAQRVRLAQPAAGESLQNLGTRSGNAWSVEYTRIANGLDPGSGAVPSPLKIGRVERYRP
jgi:predicted Zn-dependent protease